jgi:hypothetical protein
MIKKMKKVSYIILTMALAILTTSCHDFLDIVPEGVATEDNAFSNRTNAMKFLYTCYSFLPSEYSFRANPGMLGSEEFWIHDNTTLNFNAEVNAWDIGRGEQSTESPAYDCWNGNNYGKSLWIAIRDCNIFLEDIDKVPDLGSLEKARWIAEVKFLKAYYHFYLLRMYGPIPIADKNLGINSGVGEVRVYREPVDDVVNYISNLLDECIPDLPDKIEDQAQELGRITKTIAYAIKAKLLVMAASPLFNGNSDYANYVDNKGRNLFPAAVDNTKWSKAADACKEAITFAESQGNKLYTFTDAINIKDYTRTKLSLSEDICERWNNEIIWGETQSDSETQRFCFPKYSSSNNFYQAFGCLDPTLKVVENYYSDHGVPIDEDNSTFWSNGYDKRYDIVTAPAEYPNQYNIQSAGQVINLFLHREPRFYSNIGFNRGKWYVSGLSNDSTAVYNLHVMKSEYSGWMTENAPITGFFARKICSYRSTVSSSSINLYYFTFPKIRLADLYLLYAEALNESLDAPSADVYHYVDIVRARAGLGGVKESWTKYSKNPNKPNTKTGMREIIHKERTCELALEGKNFWDKHRWKEAQNRYYQGMNAAGGNAQTFYKVTTLFDRGTYNYKEYFWPISTGDLDANPNLLQSPGW